MPYQATGNNYAIFLLGGHYPVWHSSHRTLEDAKRVVQNELAQEPEGDQELVAIIKCERFYHFVSPTNAQADLSAKTWLMEYFRPSELEALKSSIKIENDADKQRVALIDEALADYWGPEES